MSLFRKNVASLYEFINLMPEDEKEAIVMLAKYITLVFYDRVYI